jgi:hypothetical protein
LARLSPLFDDPHPFGDQLGALNLADLAAMQVLGDLGQLADRGGILA